MKLHALQFDIAWEDRATNFARVEALLEEHPPEAGDLVVLPEMFSTGFSMNVEKIDEGSDQPAFRFLADLAKRYGAHVLGGVATRPADDGRGRNQAVLLRPDGTEGGRYTKIHPFSYGGENEHYASGSKIVVFDWAGFRVAPFICYDLRFPEIFRHSALRGAEVFLVIANWPTARAAHWRSLLVARAIENQAYVLGVNRCGEDPHTRYEGGSLLLDPRGRVLFEAGPEAACMARTLDKAELDAYRARFPALADIRPRFLNADNAQACSP